MGDLPTLNAYKLHMTKRLYSVGFTVNDNETYTLLGFQTLLILNRLCNNFAVLDLVRCVEEQDAERDNSPKASDDKECKRKDHREAVNERLRQFAAFEKRYGRKARGS